MVTGVQKSTCFFCYQEGTRLLRSGMENDLSKVFDRTPLGLKLGSNTSQGGTLLYVALTKCRNNDGLSTGSLGTEFFWCHWSIRLGVRDGGP